MIRPTLFIILCNWLFIVIREMVDTIFVLRKKFVKCSGDSKTLFLYYFLFNFKAGLQVIDLVGGWVKCVGLTERECEEP